MLWFNKPPGDADTHTCWRTTDAAFNSVGSKTSSEFSSHSDAHEGATLGQVIQLLYYYLLLFPHLSEGK